MRVVHFQLVLALIQISLFSGVSCIQIWSSPGALPTTIPAACRAALSQNITCSPRLVTAAFVSSGRALDNVTVSQYCTLSCYSSLQTFKSNVDQSCGNTLYKMYVNSTLQQSGAQVADPLAWAYNVTCIKDSTGFCLRDLYNGTKTACSDCSLQYGAAMLSSDYGRAKVQPNAFSSLLSSCGTPASSYPYTYTSTSASPTSTANSTQPAKCSGTQYTVSSSDTCQSISQSHSIAIDRLIAENGLDYNCSSLTQGITLCLGASCALHTIAFNETCQNIIRYQNFTTVQLTSWNPTIHPNCDNLNSMVGRSICISPPGTSNYVSTPMNITTTTMSSLFPGPFTTGFINTNPPNISTSWYNTQTTFPIPCTTTIVANATLSSLLAERTMYCPISDANFTDGISEADLPDSCMSLIAPYCWPDVNAPVPTSTIFPAECTPTGSASSTTTDSAPSTTTDSAPSTTTDSGPSPTTGSAPSTTSGTGSAAPSPLEPGTIASCKQYYLVVDGDTCSTIANHFQITLDQFDTWNPNVGTDCAKLFLGYNVCVSA